MPDESSQAMPQGVRVDVVGSMTVSCGDRVVTGQALGGRRARVALAALALADGPISADRLAAILWSDQPPPTWPTALRGVIRGLRAALTEIGAGGQRVIATMPAGYGLAPDVAVDLRDAVSVLRVAAALADQGRHDAALLASVKSPKGRGGGKSYDSNFIRSRAICSADSPEKQ